MLVKLRIIVLIVEVELNIIQLIFSAGGLWRTLQIVRFVMLLLVIIEQIISKLK